jgi:hypothetical protein
MVDRAPASLGELVVSWSVFQLREPVSAGRGVGWSGRAPPAGAFRASGTRTRFGGARSMEPRGHPMSSRQRFACACALFLWAPAFPLACASRGLAPTSNAPNTPTSNPPEPTPAATASASVSAAGPSASSAAASPTPVASESEAPPPAPPASAEPTPPCVDGEIMMGACICDKGKTADAEGHCVYPPCPKSTPGAATFRDETTGQCVECRAGTTPSKDGRWCEP